MAARVGGRLRASAFSGRTVTLKLRRYDFTTITRSQTLPQPTDDARQIAATARRLLAEAGTSGGLRLLGVGVSGLSVYAQGDLFAEEDEPEDDATPVAARCTPAGRTRRSSSRSGGGRGRTCGTTSSGPAGCGAAASGG